MRVTPSPGSKAGKLPRRLLRSNTNCGCMKPCYFLLDQRSCDGFMFFLSLFQVVGSYRLRYRYVFPLSLSTKTSRSAIRRTPGHIILWRRVIYNFTSQMSSPGRDQTGVSQALRNPHDDDYNLLTTTRPNNLIPPRPSRFCTPVEKPPNLENTFGQRPRCVVRLQVTSWQRNLR